MFMGWFQYLRIVMGAKSRGSVAGRATQQLLHVLGILSNIWFWFTLIGITYLILTSHDWLGLRYSQTDWWDEFYGISTAFLVGALVSFFFYFLVVYIPERRRRRIIKANLRKFYAEVKRDILYQIILASQKGGRTDLSTDCEMLDQLLTVEGFNSAFTGGREGHEGFYAFRNYIGHDVPEYREIILNLRILARQIDYVLHNYPITDEKAFNFFKRLEAFLIRLEAIGPGYEEEKVLSQFIWEIFGGWNFVEGQRGYDVVERMILDI